jgi:hypothetical protein
MQQNTTCRLIRPAIGDAVFDAVDVVRAGVLAKMNALSPATWAGSLTGGDDRHRRRQAT